MVEAIVRGESMTSVLITAGATRNPIDSMRHISANASGTTGANIAAALKAHASITALVSPTAWPKFHPDCRRVTFATTDDLCTRMHSWIESHPNGLVIHSAAVGDYAAVNVDIDSKLPSGQETLTITLQPTIKILDHLRAWAPSLTIVSFKAAPPGTQRQTLIDIARGQRERTDSDIVFANVIGNTDGEVSVVDRVEARTFPNRVEGLNHLHERLLGICEGKTGLAP